MRLLRKILGFGCATIGIIPPYIMYALSEDGKMWNPRLFLAMVVAATAAFLVWGCCQLWISSGKKQVLIGILGCYGSFMMLLFFAAGLKGGIAETIMWLPIIALFGIPIMAPLVGMAWIGATVAFPAQTQPGSMG